MTFEVGPHLSEAMQFMALCVMLGFIWWVLYRRR